MRILCVVIITCILCSFRQNALAQADSLKAKKQAAADTQLVITTAWLRETDSIIKADSTEKQAMLNQLESLKSSNDLKKQKELQEKLAVFQQADSLKKQQQLQRINNLRATQKGIPVAPFDDTLYYVYNKLGPLLPSERAANTERKLRQLADDPTFNKDSVLAINNENNIDIVYGDLILSTLTNDDALWMGKDKPVLAQARIQAISASIEKYQAEHSWKNLLIRIGLLIAILLVFAGLVYVINRIFRRLQRRINEKKERYFKGLKVQGYAILNPEKQLNFAYSALRIVRIVIILLMFYLTLPIIFSIFPWTKGIANSLIQWTLAPVKSMLNGVLHYLPKLLTIIVIYIVTRYVVKGVDYLAKEIAIGNFVIKGFYPDWARPTASGIKFLLYAFMFVIIFPYLPGADSKIFQGVSVFLGILFSLGSSSAISNIIAGFVITYMRPFKIGDKIKLGEITGEVIEKSLLVTRVRTITHEEITVPNASILNGHTINYSSASKDLGLILHTSVTIGYDAPWKTVHELLINAALATAHISKDKPPFVLQTSLGDFAVTYEINAYTDQVKLMPEIYSELHQQIQDKFNEAGVEIMSPNYFAHRNGASSTIPAEYQNKQKPDDAFNVRVEKSE